MKLRAQKLTAMMAAAALSISVFGSVPVRADSKDQVAAAEEDGEEASSDLLSGSFKASDSAWPVQDSYEYPFMGLKMVLPKDLLKQMEDKTVAMFPDEEWTENSDAVKYAYFSWCEMTEKQREAEVKKAGTGYYDWLAGLSKVGTLGVYDEDSVKKLDEITGCTEHKELGTSSDGRFKYYLSINKEADGKLTKELEKIETTFTDMVPFQQTSAFDQPQDTNGKDVTSLGKFESEGIDGKTYTQDVFSKYDLTLVNIFTTWCSPCVQEIPELEKLYGEMKEKGVGVVGVVMDTIGDDGKQDEEAVKKAEVLKKKTKASYPFLIPDSTMMNGRLNGISAFPETFFVDKDGNIVGETYVGGHDLNDWKEIVDRELKNVAE